MRKLVLITALLLASASAHAGPSRSLVLAAADTPAATDTAAPAPLPPAAPAATDAPKPAAAAEPAKPAATKPARRTAARRLESDEAKARRIAARYGVYW